MPMGPTGRMRAAARPWSRVRRMAVAISWPIMTSKSGPVAQAISSKSGCHQPCRSPMSPGSRAQQASILARSQPAGRKPSIIEPAKVESRFIGFQGLTMGWNRNRKKSPGEPSVQVDDDLTRERARPTHRVGFEELLRFDGGGQREGSSDQRLEQSLFDAADDVAGADLLFVRDIIRCIE